MEELNYELDLMEADLDEGFFDKIKKLGQVGAKAKNMFNAFSSLKDGNAYEATMAVLLLIPDSAKEVKSGAKKNRSRFSAFQRGAF